MPSIDYNAVRARVTLHEVLELLGFHPTERHGDQLRGPCPIHRSTSANSRSFSANLQMNAYRCFRCGAQGNQLDLWMAVNGVDLHNATILLCERLGREVPYFRQRNTRPGIPGQVQTEKRNP
jgi:DNA primase